MKNNHKLTGILVLTFLSLIFSKNIFAETQEVIHEKTFTTSPGKTLEIDAPIADISVRSWDKAEVYVKITGDEEVKEEIEFIFEETARGVRIEGEKRSSFSWDNLFGSTDLDIEVTVPKNYNTDLETSGGDVILENIEGNNELKTSGGDIKVRDTKGELSSKTSGGDVMLEYHEGNADLGTSGGDIDCRKVMGELTVKTSGGDVKCTGIEGDLLAKTSGGDIELEATDGNIIGKTSGGDVMLEYHGENKGIELSTSGGDITLVIPSDLKADLKLRSLGGDIETELSNISVEEVSSDYYEGTMNGGGRMVECSTSAGDVTVRSK
jgi:DUF4097 and DUF4098 domain-containing protein YvlB